MHVLEKLTVLYHQEVKRHPTSRPKLLFKLDMMDSEEFCRAIGYGKNNPESGALFLGVPVAFDQTRTCLEVRLD